LCSRYRINTQHAIWIQRISPRISTCPVCKGRAHTPLRARLLTRQISHTAGANKYWKVLYRAGGRN
jgi:hypothetical protein